MEWLQRAGRRVGLPEWSGIILLLVGHHANLVVVGGGHWGKCQIGVVTNVWLVEINKEEPSRHHSGPLIVLVK